MDSQHGGDPDRGARSTVRGGQASGNCVHERCFLLPRSCARQGRNVRLFCTAVVYNLRLSYFYIFQVGENEAIHILATEFGVLLTPGSAFGAPQHMRLSYGSIPPDQVPGAVQKLAAGVKHLLELSACRLDLSASRL